MKNQINSHTEVVSINEIKGNLNQIKEKYFSESELLEVDTRHIQSLAGFCALKLALKTIINQQFPNQKISEKQIIFTHNSKGAPEIGKILSINNIDPKKYKISISHTSENAYGCATIIDTVK